MPCQDTQLPVDQCTSAKVSHLREMATNGTAACSVLPIQM